MSIHNADRQLLYIFFINIDSPLMNKFYSKNIFLNNIFNLRQGNARVCKYYMVCYVRLYCTHIQSSSIFFSLALQSFILHCVCVDAKNGIGTFFFLFPILAYTLLLFMAPKMMMKKKTLGEKITLFCKQQF